MIEIAASRRLEIARSAQTAWSQKSVPERVQALRGLRRAIAGRMDEIVATISEEVGKPPLDALSGDVLVTLEQLRYYERFAGRILRPRAIGKPAILYRGANFRELFEPYGVALIFAPWNYPLQLAAVPAITALFAGNSAIVKCSERTPKTAALLELLCRQARLPKGLVQVCCDAPEKAAALLDAGPDIVFFTGSSRAGRLVAQRSAALPIPSLLELGGKDACLVFASCDLGRAVEGAVYGSFSNAGQVCLGIKRLYVEETIYDGFLRRFLARSRSLRIGAGVESDLGPVRFAAVRDLLVEQVEEAIAMGAVLHTEWDRRSSPVPPLVLTDVPAGCRLMQEESFGPVVCIGSFRDEAEAVRLANGSAFSLGASVFTGDREQARRLAGQLHAGTCSVNDAIRTIGNPYAAFGGNGASGYGRYHGPAGLYAFSRVKTVMTCENAPKSEIHWFPHREATFRRLREILRLRHARASLRGRWKSLLRLFCLVLSVASLAPAAHGSPPAALSLDVMAPPHARGSIAYLVFSSPDGFPGDPGRSLRHGFVPLAGGRDRQRIDLGPLPPGHYAVSVYLDVNGNHKLDQGFLGIPKEPVGASNNPSGLHGPPRFNECVFVHRLTAQTIPILLKK